MSKYPRFLVAASCLLLALSRAGAAVVINEIMYHSTAVPENTAHEWIELYNDSPTATVNLAGWKFTKGVDFTFPNGTTMTPGAYLVVAANIATFQAQHPGFAGPLLGGWVGTMSNGGEHLKLVDTLLAVVAELHFANDGEWGTRGRGPLLLTHRGWDWFTDANGLGKTIELRNPALASFDSGQNWGVSAAVGGSPGAVNSVATANVAPLIKDVKHKPDVPHTTDPIVVSCNLHDEAAGALATLHWRLDGGSFTTLPMTDTDGDGDVEATIPAQANLAVVEWYISATDVAANSRTWPTPARTSDIGVLPETFAQVTNALVQVDNSFDAIAAFQAAGSHPIYRLIMTAAERAELTQIQTNAAQDASDALMNMTFISHDGTGVQVRYLAGLRNRGTGSRLGPPNNYHVAFRNDDVWEGRGSLQLNCRYPHSQALGAFCFQRAGIAPQESAPVRIRVNGADLAEPGLRMYGRYVRNETMGGSWAKRHYPNDPDGNVYFLDDHAYPANDPRSGEFRYEGTDPALYSDTYLKKTNEEFNDYTDFIALTDKLNNTPDATFVSTIQQVVDLDQWLTFIATDALVGNQEGGLQSGRADDAGLYRGIVDPRFKFIPHDFDSVFSFGLNAQDPGGPGGGGAFGTPTTRSIFSYDGEAPTTGVDGVLGLRKIFNHPEVVPRYYAKLLEQMDKWFNHATLDPAIDQLLGGWVAASGTNVSVASAKAYITTRTTNVLAMIQQNYALSVTTGAAAVGGYTTTTDGSATISGTFNVAKTYSITVNGVPAQWFYRTAGADVAGSWKLAVAAGGGSVLKPGLNKLVVNFWDGINGTGKIVQTLNTDVFYNIAGGTTITGTLSAGSLRIFAPASYIPGKPFLVRIDQLDGSGNLNRAAWDTTVTLSSNVGGITLPTVPLYNGVGSALVTAGGSGGGGTTQLIVPGGTLQVPNASAPDWRMLYTATADPAATWKSDQAFNDSAWTLSRLQAGAGDADERTDFTVPNVDTTQTTRRAFYFRKIFSVANPAAFTQLLIKAVVDDGAVFYLNGTEVSRDNMPAGTPTLTTPASTNRSAPAEAAINTYDISAFLNLLVLGNNLLAVEIHNFSSSADLSFDCELDGVAPSTDPGTFTLTATAGVFTAQKTIASLTTAPTTTLATGTLPVATTTWSGVIHVTGDVTVPVGGTLNIAAGTHVLVDGDATAGSTAGKRIIVNGTFTSQGTLASPVAISAFNATDRWGGFSFSSAQPSTFNYTLLNHAGHTTGVGHTGRGPMLRIATSTVSLLDSTFADGPAKAIYSSGTCSLTILRSLLERMITGPEVENGCTVACTDSNIQRMLPDYRESNAPLADDEDCFYVHNGSGASVVMNRCVFARCGDDVIDCLGAPDPNPLVLPLITVQDCILREGWDKGLSLLNNDLNITRTQIIRCDKAIAQKSQNADTRTVTATNVTIVGENHDSTQAPWGYTGGVASGDPDTPSTGFYTQNKAGQSNTLATLQSNAKNCIVIAQSPVLVDSPYDPTKTAVTYSDLALVDYTNFTWPGTGNVSANPLFVAAGTNDYHLTAASPAHNTGDPASPLDADGSRADMGALPFGGAGASVGTITWSPAGGPYRVTGDVTIPPGTTLVINAGTSVLFDLDKKMTVNGTIKVLGTDAAHVVFSNVPGTTATDPITGIAGQPAKWAGLVVVGPAIGAGPAITGSEFRYCNFFNAQPAFALGNTGSLGIIRAFALIDHCIFLGTHLRQVYGENCALQVQYSIFVDPFDPLIAGDNPVAYNLDNIAEPLKVANANNADPNYVFGLPVGGYFRVWYNEFRGNKGHNDVFDADSGGFNAAAGVNNTNPILDCRYNNFLGLTGDEHIDLGGDAYVAGNVFQRGHKDEWTNDHGYSNCISSGDKSGLTTIWVARNIAFNVDHVMNCKASTATIFEYNTVANFNADFSYTSTPPVAAFTQNVKCSAINEYVPDDNGPTRGDGAYIAGNIFHNIPRVVTWADLPATLATKLEATNNYINGLADNSVGPVTAEFSGGTLHPGGFTALGPFVQPGNPQFENEAAGNYALKIGSPARGTAPGGIDYGASAPEWASIFGGPSGTTDQTSATFTIGGPAMVAYKWRLDGGAWSAMQQIGGGLIFPRSGATVRTATLAQTGLAPGAHTLEVVGRDPAGNWQDTDLARTVAGLPPLPPTVRTWTVDTVAPVIRITEVLAESATLPDTIELQNQGSATVNIGGWTLSDDPLVPAKYTIPANTMLAPGAFITFTATTTLISLDRNGDAVYLRNGATLVDSIAFGNQIPEFTIGRIGTAGTWTLCTNNGTPGTVGTFGAANVAARLGDPSAVRINEWFTGGDVLYDADWIELSNPGALPVDIAGLRITDNRIGDASATTFAPLTFIPANGFARFIADGTTSQGPSHLSFSLDAQQETISLLGATGSLLDTITFFPQTTDYSMGRDALGNYVFYELPTRGLVNGTSDPGYPNALAILRGLRITEIMFNAIGGSDFDYIELTNTGATPLALGGVSFVQGIAFTFPAMTLNPGEYVVVVKHLAKFRSRYGNAPVVAGVYTGQIDNGGETIGLQLPPPFDANALTFAYSDTWYPPTDGFGPSLVVTNALVKAGVWGDRDTWSASAINGGNPGGVTATLLTYSGFSARNAVLSVTEDIDRDSIGALMEFSLGMDITNPNAGYGVAGLPRIGRAGDGRATLSFLVPENAGAVQGHGFPDVTYNVQAADVLGIWTTIATKTYGNVWSGTGAATVGAASGGYVPVTISDIAPLGTPPRYLRLQTNWTP